MAGAYQGRENVAGSLSLKQPIAFIAWLSKGPFRGVADMKFNARNKARLLGKVALVALAAGALAGSVAWAQNTRSGQEWTTPLEPAPRDAATNLANKIMEPFTVVAVGDVMVKRPIGNLDIPAFHDIAKLMQDADVTHGNMEGNLGDLDHFVGPLRGMMGDKDVAPALKEMGFDIMGRANNHVFDSERESLFSTMEQLDKAGIIHAGDGHDLEEARAPAYYDSAKGRVALVSMHGPNNPDAAPSAATYRSGNIGGRVGFNPINYTIWFNVTQEQMDTLKKMRQSLYTAPAGTTNVSSLPANEPADRLEFLNNHYKIGTPGTRNFVMNPSDLKENLRSIRNGKYLSDFEIVNCHCHQGPITSQQWLFEDQTPDMLIELAHGAVDNGADMFVGSGPHVLRGIEIYKGKPIFYGLGENYYQWQHFDADVLSGSWAREEPKEGVDVRVSQALRAINFESVVTKSYYDKGKLVEVRLYPTEGGWNGPISQLGMPRTPSPEQANKILTRLAALSKPFGTDIVIEKGVGYIRIK